MSLDKLKTSWDSLNDSVDQKEIVAIKEMRKELYDSKHKRLKRKIIQCGIIYISIMFLAILLRITITQEMDRLSTALFFATLSSITSIVFATKMGLNNIKMNNNIQALKKNLQKRIKNSKIELVIVIIIIPIIIAMTLELARSNNIRGILILLSLGTSCLNTVLFYIFYSTNKIYNSMLEDIKQLEELDMY